jgi:hypothetical protein
VTSALIAHGLLPYQVGVSLEKVATVSDSILR